MNEILPMRPMPVPEGQAASIAHFSEVASFQGETARRALRDAKRWKWIGAAACALAVVNGLVIVTLLPTVRVVPAIAVLDDKTGTAIAYGSVSEVPLAGRQAAVEAALWQYVRERESYNPVEISNAWAIVSAMSSPGVRSAYQDYAKFTNPESPSAKLTDKGFITVDKVKAAFLYHAPDFKSGGYQIEFRWTVTAGNGEPPQSKIMVVNFAYVISDEVPIWQRTSFNPAGIVVTSYDPPMPVGGARK